MISISRIACGALLLLALACVGCGENKDTSVLPAAPVSDADVLKYQEDGEKSRLDESKYD